MLLGTISPGSVMDSGYKAAPVPNEAAYMKPTPEDLAVREPPLPELLEEAVPSALIRGPSDVIDDWDVGDDESLYGKPRSAAHVAEMIPRGPGGLIWHAELVSDKWTSASDCDANGCIKPRRPLLPVRETDFFASLVKTADGRWIFSGKLNGWPALTCLELRSITVFEQGVTGVSVCRVKRVWDAIKTPDEKPMFPEGQEQARATLWMPAWSALGWSPKSFGFVWWFMPHHPRGERFAYGESMIMSAIVEEALVDAKVVRIHSIAHRYARGGKPETTKESITWHSLILLEWDHGRHCTVVELATLNGVGGRRGKSNWYHDKLEHNTQLYKAMPPEMIMPWKGHFAELRCADVEANSLEAFIAYMKQYDGPTLRFLDPQVQHSADVRLWHCSKSDIARYLLNYMGRDRRYTEQSRNCQSFASDFFSFVAGKKDIWPFHQANRLFYQNRSHLFLYDPEQFQKPVVKDF
jgi:hypothetical protein